jgi:hypothetical protein
MNVLRRGLSVLMISSLLSVSIPAFAATEIMEDDLDGRPTAGAALADAGIARPLMLAGTIGGAAVFLASLPFSILGGNVKEAAKTLVIDPANATFRRCMGCTTVQDELKTQNTAMAQSGQYMMVAQGSYQEPQPAQ